MKKIILICFLVYILGCVSGCAAGSATAGFALHANTANGLTQDAVYKLKQEIKTEILTELKSQK